ncbi:Cadherin-like beta sandwich domain [Chlamydia abortus]|nr:Cadherin-like beta sandwich domain [Chlamydia abortus]
MPGYDLILFPPEFDPSKELNYYGTVTNDVHAISLNPTTQYPDDTKVRIFLNGKEVSADEWDNLPLQEGKNIVKVGVYNRNGDQLSIYTIEILRESNKLESLVPSVGSLNPEFDPAVDSYTMRVANSVSQLQLTPKAFDPNAKIEIRVGNRSWQEVTSGNASDYLALNVGNNTITVKVTGQDGKVKEYTITVTRVSSGNNFGGYIGAPLTPNRGDLVSTIDGDDASFVNGAVKQVGNRTQTTATIDTDKLSDILEGEQLAIHSPTEGDLLVEGITAEFLKGMADRNVTLNISNPLAIYPVPIGKLDLKSVSDQFDGAALTDIDVHVGIARSSDALIESAETKAKEDG